MVSFLIETKSTMLINNMRQILILVFIILMRNSSSNVGNSLVVSWISV